MGHDTEKAEASSCSFQKFRVRDSTLFTINIYIFDYTDLVAKSLVLAACAMANGSIDASKGYPVEVRLV